MENGLEPWKRRTLKNVKKCYSCNTEMQYAEKVPFRIKGMPRFWKLIVGERGGAWRRDALP
jgi:hypothetical protein